MGLRARCSSPVRSRLGGWDVVGTGRFMRVMGGVFSGKLAPRRGVGLTSRKPIYHLLLER